MNPPRSCYKATLPTMWEPGTRRLRSRSNGPPGPLNGVRMGFHPIQRAGGLAPTVLPRPKWRDSGGHADIFLDQEPWAAMHRGFVPPVDVPVLDLAPGHAQLNGSVRTQS